MSIGSADGNIFPKNDESDIKALKAYKFALCRGAETVAMLGSPSLMKSINATNLERYRLAAHSLLMASTDIGDTQVAKYARYLECAAGAYDTKYVSNFTPAFIACLNKTIADIDNAIAVFYSKNPRPKLNRPDGHLLARLCNACRAYRIDEINELIEALCLFEYESDGELISWLEESVGREAYGIAAEVLLERRFFTG